jgi:mannose/cellobiose epimerase-like protein (N-acyl-D-glucosamine 2-epimerase family)
MMSNSREKFAALRPVLLKSLEQDILRFWTEKAIDTVNGGFYGHIDHLSKPHPEAGKGVILNTRILWTYSAAASFLNSSVTAVLQEERTNISLSFLQIKNSAGSIGNLMPPENP